MPVFMLVAVVCDHRDCKNEFVTKVRSLHDTYEIPEEEIPPSWARITYEEALASGARLEGDRFLCANHRPAKQPEGGE